MKKSVIAMTALVLSVVTGTAMANPSQGKSTPNPAFEQAISECHAKAGVPAPQKMQAPTQQNAAKQDKAGQPKPKGERPKLTEAQKKSIGECMSAKGFEKPAKAAHKKGEHHNQSQRSQQPSLTERDVGQKIS
ncbi:MAG: hypothetical protein Q4C68_05240 [Moraxella sp.]|nr:hypothetical protein [Moraxella sp.]